MNRRIVVSCSIVVAAGIALGACGDDKGADTSSGSSSGGTSSSSGGTSSGGTSGSTATPGGCASFAGTWKATKIECGPGMTPTDKTSEYLPQKVDSVTVTITVTDAEDDKCHAKRVTTKAGACTNTEEGDLSKGSGYIIGQMKTTACDAAACKFHAAGDACSVGGSFAGGVSELDLPQDAEGKLSTAAGSTFKWGYPSGGGDCAKLGLGASPTRLTFTKQ